MNENYELIREAIAKKMQVIAEYKGHLREMCPHVIGTKNGVPQALFYQFGGSSSRGLYGSGRTKWRCIPIGGLKNVQLRIGKWYTDSSHTRPQTCVDKIDLSVSDQAKVSESYATRPLP